MVSSNRPKKLGPRSQKSLAEKAKKVLAANDLGASTRPSPGLYPHQWNWDSAFIAIGLSRYDPARARTEILSLLRGQWRNGMIPHIIYQTAAKGYFPDAERWQIDRSPDAPAGVLTSGITQPPMVTIAAYEVALRSDLDFARQVFPQLLAYHRWFHRERDPLKEGLVAIIHPWESGMDNSPRWVAALDSIHLEALPEYERQDNEFVSEDQRPLKWDYDRYVHLLDLGSELAYDQSKILERSPFVVQDVFLNSILYQADACLGELARMVGEPAGEMEGWMITMKDSFERAFWQDGRALYLDVDVRNRRQVDQNTIAVFAPLYAGLVDGPRARSLVEKHLLNPDEYYLRDGNNGRLVPTTSMDSLYFNPSRYWCGPVWVNTNWIVIQGLKQYGFDDLARQVCLDTLSLLDQNGFHEYFDPFTGQGYGTDAFSWSAALALALLSDTALLA